MNDDEGRNALLFAARNGDTNAVKRLLKRGVEVNSINQYGVTPLMLAAQHGHLETVRYLCANGADVNKVDSFGNSAVGDAIKHNEETVLSFLLEAGGNANEYQKQSTLIDVAMGLCVEETGVRIVRLLLRHGADPNCAGLKFGKYLFNAAQSGRTAVFRELVLAGAHFPDTRTYDLAVSYAIGWKDMQLQALIQSIEPDASLMNKKPDGTDVAFPNAMTPAEARTALMFHSGSHEDIADPRWSDGFVGSLRPFTGLREENYREVVECLRALAPVVAAGADKEIQTALWFIVFANVCWGLSPNSALQRNKLISPDEIRILAGWTRNICWIVYILMQTGSVETAFNGLDDRGND